MLGNISKLLRINFIVIILLSSVVVAGEIDQGDIPEICVACSTVALEYADVDTCWPGDTISVQVLVTNADTLSYLQIWGLLPSGLSYDTLNSNSTPWTGEIRDFSSGDTIEIHLARSDTSWLPPGTLERVIDLKLVVSDVFSFAETLTVKFGHYIIAEKKGVGVDCNVSDTTWGTVIIPNDSVTVTFDSVLAYSYQASDDTDQAKLDNPLRSRLNCIRIFHAAVM